MICFQEQHTPKVSYYLAEYGRYRTKTVYLLENVANNNLYLLIDMKMLYVETQILIYALLLGNSHRYHKKL